MEQPAIQPSGPDPPSDLAEHCHDERPQGARHIAQRLSCVKQLALSSEYFVRQQTEVAGMEPVGELKMGAQGAPKST